MRELPRALRWYLGATYAAAVALVVWTTLAVATGAAGQRALAVPPSDVIVYGLLAFVAERATLHVGGSVALSVATPVHIAMILLFRSPIPLLITLASALASQPGYLHAPAYKRAFNVCHPALVVGLCSLITSLFGPPSALLRSGQIAEAIPTLTLLLTAYYVLDAGLLLGVQALLDGGSPRLIWWQTRRRTVLPELAGEAMGIVAAVAWRYDHLMLALLVLPAVALRAAFQAIARAEAAQHLAEAAQHLAEAAQHRAEHERHAAEEAQVQAENALRVRDEFLTAASHELRTPLTGVVGFADVMQMRLARADGDPTLRTQLEALRRAAARMVSIVEEITDAAELQIGHRLSLRLEDLDLGALVRTVSAQAQAAAPAGAAPVVVTAADSVVVQADRARLERVMRNIVGNAIKYSPHGSTVYVQAFPSAAGGVITVRDSGVGIPPDDLPHIFTHYYRASTSIGIKGAGIGLAGSRAIVEQHGGTVTATSALSAGTTITVCLPRSARHVPD